jgi:hypothetical protein
LSNFEISEEFFRRLQETGIEGREREGELQQNYIFTLYQSQGFFKEREREIEERTLVFET